MAGSRLVQTALRCYPARWRSRHGEDAAELAVQLMRDGTTARSIAWSYFKGAAGARLVLQPRGRLRVAAGALVAAACALGLSLALLSPSVPASATSKVPGTTARPGEAHVAGTGISRPGDRPHCRTSAQRGGERHDQHC